jgi:hypothetical protein
VQQVDVSESRPWRESLERSRARRLAAVRARRRRWSGRSAVGAVAASLTLAAGGAFAAQGPTAGGATAGGTTTAPAVAKKVSVRSIQRALGIRADGALGPQTRRALKRFQRAHGIKADGVAGPITLTALGLTAQPDVRGLDSVPAGDATTVLAKIAQCESGGNIAVVSRGGTYRGKYQFSVPTWESLGGTGDPAAADEATQDQMAAKLFALKGTAPWPACSAQL